jgi:DNA-directed RNA polymerase subunit RPC12/RpoP
VTGLLNFNPHRKLEFDPGRPLQFDMRRTLEFDPGRDLLFNENRDLGFGRRGVVFRGYVCPICGSLVTETATRCTECGAVFEGPPRASQPPSPTTHEGRAPEPGKAKPSTPSGKAGKADRISCAYCGTALKRADTFCSNCGKATAGPRGVVKLPPQKKQNMTRDWRGPREP